MPKKPGSKRTTTRTTTTRITSRRTARVNQVPPRQTSKKIPEYNPPKRLLDLIQKTWFPSILSGGENKQTKFLDRLKLINWSDFKKYSLLPETKTVLLWNRHYPERKLFVNTIHHPFVALLVANKIYLERNKTLKQISSEVFEIISKKVKIQKGLNPPFVEQINKYLKLRSSEELTYFHGGLRTKTSKKQKARVLRLLRENPISKVSDLTGVDYWTVREIGIENKLFVVKESGPRLHRIPEATRQRTIALIEEGILKHREIARIVGVSHSFVDVLSRLIKKQE